MLSVGEESSLFKQIMRIYEGLWIPNSTLREKFSFWHKIIRWGSQ